VSDTDGKILHTHQFFQQCIIMCHQTVLFVSGGRAVLLFGWAVGTFGVPLALNDTLYITKSLRPTQLLTLSAVVNKCWLKGGWEVKAGMAHSTC